MSDLFDRPEALEEKLDDIELSDKQKAEATRLAKKIRAWHRKKEKKIVAFVGKFGSGKSATLREIEDQFASDRRLKKVTWLNFDAWRYANRGQLWDGFVVEIEAKINDSEDQQKIADAIDGVEKANRFTQQHPFFAAGVVVAIWLLLSSLIWFGLQNHNESVYLFFKALLKYAIPALFALLAIIGISTLFRKKRPLTRVFQLEEMLKQSLGKSKTPLIVVVEDVDRAGEEGVIFLETLRNFLDRLNDDIKHSIVVVAPQDVTYMSALNNDKIKGLERSVKVYNAVSYYGSSLLQHADIDNLLAQARIKEEYREQLAYIFKDVLWRYRDQLSFRLIKFMLREVDEFKQAYSSANPALALIFISMRYIKIKNSSKIDELLLDNFNKVRHGNIHTSISHTELSQVMAGLSHISNPQEQLDRYKVNFTTVEGEIRSEADLNQSNIAIRICFNVDEKYLALLD